MQNNDIVHAVSRFILILDYYEQWNSNSVSGFYFHQLSNIVTWVNIAKTTNFSIRARFSGPALSDVVTSWLTSIDRGFIEQTSAEDMVICKNICPGARKVYQSTVWFCTLGSEAKWNCHLLNSCCFSPGMFRKAMNEARGGFDKGNIFRRKTMRLGTRHHSMTKFFITY